MGEAAKAAEAAKAEVEHSWRPIRPLGAAGIGVPGESPKEKVQKIIFLFEGTNCEI